MMRIKLIFLFFILSLSFYTEASSCESSTKSVDMRDDMPPIRDQDSIGWCYSYTGADLLGHYLLKNKDRLDELINYPQGIDPKSEEGAISATSLAINYNNDFRSSYNQDFSMWQSEDFNHHNDKVLELRMKKNGQKFQPPVEDDETYEVVAEGGEVEDSIESSINKGFCLEKDMPSSDFAYTDSFFTCEVLKEAGSCGLKGVLQRIYDYEVDGIGGQAWCDAQVAIQTLFPSILLESMVDVMLLSTKENIIQNLETVQCQLQFKEKKPFEVKTIALNHSWRCSFLQKSKGLCNFKGGNKKLFKELDKQLDKGNIVGIAYKSEFLKDPEAKHEKNSHASSIVGKRTNPETCETEYILRNSWGAGCEQYTNYNVEVPGQYECYENTGVTEEMKRELYEKTIPEFIEEGKKSGWSDFIIEGGVKDLEAMVNKREIVSQEVYDSRIAKCEKEFPSPLKNPKLKCEGEGYLIIPKSELKKHMYEITFIE